MNGHGVAAAGARFLPSNSCTRYLTVSPPADVYVISTRPGPGTTKSVALYCGEETPEVVNLGGRKREASGAAGGRTWSPCACLPMMMGLTQPGTRRGMFLQMMASRNTVPPRMLRMVPLGERHICFSLNSSTRFSSGVMVAHLMPTW